MTIKYFGFPGIKMNMLKDSKIDLWELNRAKPIECFEIVKKTVCQYYGINPEDLHSSKRDHPLPVAKQLFSYITKIKLFPNVSIRVIGEFIGTNRRTKKPYDRTTVMHGIQEIKNKLFTKEYTEENIDDIVESTRIHFTKLWNQYKS